MHAATARVDLRRVHPSWWARALKDESAAIQRSVTASLPQKMRERLQSELLLDSQDLLAERPPHPEVLSWVLALWAERIVGGDAGRPDDPPAIVVLTLLAPRAGYRLCHLAGRMKLAMAGHALELGRPSQAERARREWLKSCAQAALPEERALARQDVQAAINSNVPRRHVASRIGLVTLARLLADCEPFRLRFALEHWPYTIAKLTRSLMPPAGKRPGALLHEELVVLKTAWERLNLEGRLTIPWPDPHRVTASQG
jgi:hypothetical protein